MRLTKGGGSHSALSLPVALCEEPASQIAFVEPRPPELQLLHVETHDLPSSTIAAGAVNIDEMNQRAEAAFDSTKPIVLYVEGNSNLRAHVRDILSERYNLFVADDGADGFEKARRYYPDVILTEQKTPRVDGRKFLLTLREDVDLRSIPVVFLTAQYGVEGRIESLDAGADDYVSKPFHEAELQACVLRLIRARWQQRELRELNCRLRAQVRDQSAELARAAEFEQFLPRPVLEARRKSAGTSLAPVRRPITVLVAELPALPALAERLDEPALAALVDEHFGAIGAICTARGGTIDGLSGGRLSALFASNDECSPAQAAWSAAQAAFEIRHEMLELTAAAHRRGIAGAQLRGIGIASGSSLIGAFGAEAQRIYTAIGQAVRRAAELHVLAGRGSIACDRATSSLLAGQIRVREFEGPLEASDAPGSRYEITALAADFETPLSLPPTARSESPALCGRIFRREGDYWTVVHGERVFRLKHSKGTAYLAQLLARPHVEIHVCELVQADERHEHPPRALSHQETTHLGLRSGVAETPIPRLDPRAKNAYRERLEDLAEQLEEARTFGDNERALRAESERARLAQELAAAVGLRGRDRLGTSATERFRVNVTRSLKAVLNKLRQENPELGRHLCTSIRTGTFCSYSPPPGAADTWNVSF